MNKKQKSSIILASLASIAVAGSLIAGSTYALFTSESETNIAIGSGIVNVVATLSDAKLYSPTLISPEEGNVIINPDNAASETMFANGGTFTRSEGAYSLNNMVPGDKATFDIKIENKSNVDIKYRVKVTKSEDTGLYDGLKINIPGFSINGNSVWTYLEYDEDNQNIATLEGCTVELPTTAGNNYQEKSCKISFAVEAIQANAKTVDTYAVNIIESENGSVTSNKLSEDVGGSVEFNILPDDGYTIDTLSVNGEYKNDYTPIDGTNNFSYLTNMVDGGLNVKATFKAKQAVTDGTPTSTISYQTIKVTNDDGTTSNAIEADIKLEKNSESTQSTSTTNNEALKNALNEAINKFASTEETISKINITLPETSTDDSFSLVELDESGNRITNEDLKDIDVVIEGTETTNDSGEVVRTRYETISDKQCGSLDVYDKTFKEAASVTFKNVDFVMTTNNEKASNGLDGQYFTFENCTFKGTMHYFGQDGTTSFKNCVFTQTGSKLFWLNNIQDEYIFDGCAFNSTETGEFFNLYKNNGEYESTNFSNTCKVVIKNSTFNGKGSAGDPLLCIKLGDKANYQIYFNKNNVLNNVDVYDGKSQYTFEEGITSNTGTDSKKHRKGYGYLDYNGSAIYGVRCDGSHSSFNEEYSGTDNHPNEIGPNSIYKDTKVYLVDGEALDCVFDGSTTPTVENNNKTINE